MNASPAMPSAGVYVVKLLPSDPGAPGRLAGRLEHVLSGRRHDFDNGAALLACLAHEQSQGQAVSDASSLKG
jgi:hypothetical protein